MVFGAGDGPLLVFGGLQGCSPLHMSLWQQLGAESRWLRKEPWRVDVLGKALDGPRSLTRVGLVSIGLWRRQLVQVLSGETETQQFKFPEVTQWRLWRL